MVTGICLIQLEMKQFLLQYQFLFNSEPIKSLTFLTEFQQMSQKRKRQKGGGGGGQVGKSQFTEKLYNSLTDQKMLNRASLVAQWLRIRLPMQGTRDPWFGKIPHAAQQLSPCATTTDPEL